MKRWFQRAYQISSEALVLGAIAIFGVAQLAFVIWLLYWAGVLTWLFFFAGGSR